ncbi:MAG: hypothetical protein LBG48_03410, partial [Rickettsiales bacterium]|nr:hypothetical protein [Rickettsiales bacterium]
FHEWFINTNSTNKEDRKACLLNLIDDNTNIIELMFDKQERFDYATLVSPKRTNTAMTEIVLFCINN